MRIVRGLAWLGLVLALAAAAGFYAGVLEEDRLLDALVRGPLAGVERSDTAVVLAPAHAIHERTNRGVRAADLPLVERLESTSPFNMTAAVCLKHGVFGVIGHRPYGQCGPMTRILLNACWRLGIPARKLHLLPPTPSGPDIHTLAEWRSSGRWQVISPSDDFVWRTRDGRVATVEEIRADTTIFDQVRARYPDCLSFFIRTSSPEEYEQRLRKRGTESEEQIAVRLATARRELERVHEFDEVIVNDDLDTAVAHVRDRIARAFHKGGCDAG